ncbi:class I ribonucleotide reductase maintenance protein YfaE [Photobacterium sp. J15]|uniref:class I ribonucleotide reductase maintenance protein YfaE n=1 Tax=Photobacterium sp. J15 TaxID=265901 RepID=UPI0007E42B15|nr:class I ribonucleotide reductase maintenance protein YfaE [Photobacterium sp. J15]
MKASITIEDQTIANVDTSLSILESLEKNDVKVEFQCRDGYCGACRCKLIDGEVSYFRDTIAFVGEGEVLTCSATPASDITIEV